MDYAFSSFGSHRLHAGTRGAIKDDAVAYRADFSTNHYGSDVDGQRTALDRLTGSLLFKISDALKLTLEVDKMRDDVEDYYYGTPLVDGKIARSLRRVNYNNLSDNDLCVGHYLTASQSRMESDTGYRGAQSDLLLRFVPELA